MARVLLVVDDLSLITAYDILMVKAGHTVEREKSGDEAVRKTETFQPDLVLLDMMLPKMTGLEYLKSINLKEKYPNTKVIALSNMSMPDEMQEAYALGASAYIIKSETSPKKLAEIIQQTLQE